MRLNKKVVLITASTRGIGLACVKECAKEGAIVYMGARNLELAKDISLGLCNQGYNVKYVYNDASKPETFNSMIKDVIQNEGHLDVLVNNFGTSNPKKDLDIINTNIDILEMEYGENESFNDIHNQIDKLKDLTNNLVLLTKIEESKSSINLIDQPISDILIESIAPFKNLAITQNKKIEAITEKTLVLHIKAEF